MLSTFFRQRFVKPAFLATRSWLVGQKIGGHFGPPKLPYDVTGCVDFVLGQKSRVKIRDVAGGLSPQILCFRNLRAARKSRTVSLTYDLRIGSILWPFQFGLDIFTIFSCTQAIQCAVPSSWNCLTSTRIEMASAATTKAIEYDKHKTSRSDFRKHSLLEQQLSGNNAILDKICFYTVSVYLRSFDLEGFDRKTHIRILVSITWPSQILASLVYFG